MAHENLSRFQINEIGIMTGSSITCIENTDGELTALEIWGLIG